MTRVLEDVTFPLRDGERTVNDLPHDKCRSCGERIFDHQANVVIDSCFFAGRTKGRRQAVAAREQ